MDSTTVSTTSSGTGGSVNPPNGIIAPAFYQSRVSKGTFTLDIKVTDEVPKDKLSDPNYSKSDIAYTNSETAYNKAVSDFGQIKKPSILLLRRLVKDEKTHENVTRWFGMTYPRPPANWSHPFPLNQSLPLMEKLDLINSNDGVVQVYPLVLAEVVSHSYFKQVFEELQKDANPGMSVKLSFGFSVLITQEALPESFPKKPCTFILSAASGGWVVYFSGENGDKPVIVERPPIFPDPLTDILPDLTITSLTDKQIEELRALFCPDFVESYFPTKLPFYVEVKNVKSPNWVDLPHYEFTFVADEKTGDFRTRSIDDYNAITKDATDNNEEFIPALVGLAFDSSASKLKGFMTKKSEDPNAQKEFYSLIGATTETPINATVQKLAAVTFEKRTLQETNLRKFMENAKYAVSIDHSDWLKNFLSEVPPKIEDEERKKHCRDYKDFYVNKFFVPYTALGMLKIDNPNFKLKYKPAQDQQDWLQKFFDERLPKDATHTVCLTYSNRLACLELSEDLRNCTANKKGIYWAGLLHEYLVKTSSLNLITTELLTDSDSRMARYANLLSVLDPNRNFSRNFLAKVYYVKLFREINNVDFSTLDDAGRKYVEDIIARMIEKLLDSTDERDKEIKNAINEFMKQQGLNKQQAGFQIGVAFSDFLRVFQNKNQNDFIKNMDDTLAKWRESGAPSKFKLMKTNFFRFLGVALAIAGLVFSFMNWDNMDALGKTSAIAGALKVVHTTLTEATMAYKNWMLVDEFKASRPQSIELADMGRRQTVQNSASEAQASVRPKNNQKAVPKNYHAMDNEASGLAQNKNKGVGSKFRVKSGWDKFLAWSGIILSVIMLGLAVWQLVNYFLQDAAVYKKILQSFYVFAELVSVIIQVLEVVAVNLVAKFAAFFFWAGLIAGIAALVITVVLLLVELFVKDDTPFDVFMRDTVIPGIGTLQTEEKNRIAEEAKAKAEAEKEEAERKKALEKEKEGGERPKMAGFFGADVDLLPNSTFDQDYDLKKVLDENEMQILLMWNKMKIQEWNEEIERNITKNLITN